ncbi:guanine deaminase [Simkania negevensis Z]|uniref:Guanine deaminase n=2 Tax=Simkania negevensis TaxID=83561 RepID=F8L7Y9_SIMNZ|nr:guanine deaminase [Simkania negevensis Z]
MQHEELGVEKKFAFSYSNKKLNDRWTKEMAHTTSVLGTLISPLDSGDFLTLEKGAITYDQEGTILNIGQLQEPVNHQVIDTNGALILPGLIDTHNHLSQYPIVGACDLAIGDWLEKYVFPEEIHFNQDLEFAAFLSRTFFQQALSQGTTCMATFVTSSAQATTKVFQEAHQSGLRAIVGQVLMDINSPPHLKTDLNHVFEQLDTHLRSWHKRGELEVSINPRFAVTCSEQLLRQAAHYAQTHDLLLHTHLDYVPEFAMSITQNFPWADNLLEVFKNTDFFTPRTLFAHGTGLSESEWKELGKKHAAICHCPNSNIFWNMGLLPVTKLIDWGSIVALGTDSGGGANLSLFDIMRSASEISHILQEQKVSENKLSLQDLLRMATLNGAKALGLQDKVGSLERGKDADFIIVQDQICDPLYPNSLSSYQKPLERLGRTIFRPHPQQVKAVYIKGKKVWPI